MNVNILKVFPETPMYFSHKGLIGLLAKHKIKEIKEGDFYVFVNKAATAFKVITGNDGRVIVYYKSPSASRPISIEAIRYIPHFFGGQDAGYTKALEHVLRKKIPQIFREEDAA